MTNAGRVPGLYQGLRTTGRRNHEARRSRQGLLKVWMARMAEKVKPDDHDIVTRHQWGYDNSTMHEAVCRCGWKVWEETELAATLAWMLHNVDVIAVEAARQASRARHPSGPGIEGPY